MFWSCLDLESWYRKDICSHLQVRSGSKRFLLWFCFRHFRELYARKCCKRCSRGLGPSSTWMLICQQSQKLLFKYNGGISAYEIADSFSKAGTKFDQFIQSVSYREANNLIHNRCNALWKTKLNASKEEVLTYKKTDFFSISFFLSFLFLFFSLFFLLLSACITISTAQYPKMTVTASFVANGH